MYFSDIAPGFVSDGAGRRARDPLEDPAEICLILESRAGGDFGDAFGAAPEEADRVADAQAAQILPERNADLLMEDSAQVVFAGGDVVGELPARNLLAEGAVEEEDGLRDDGPRGRGKPGLALREAFGRGEDDVAEALARVAEDSPGPIGQAGGEGRVVEAPGDAEEGKVGEGGEGFEGGGEVRPFA